MDRCLIQQGEATRVHQRVRNDPRVHDIRLRAPPFLPLPHRTQSNNNQPLYYTQPTRLRRLPGLGAGVREQVGPDAGDPTQMLCLRRLPTLDGACVPFLLCPPLCIKPPPNQPHPSLTHHHPGLAPLLALQPRHRKWRHPPAARPGLRGAVGGSQGEAAARGGVVGGIIA